MSDLLRVRQAVGHVFWIVLGIACAVTFIVWLVMALLSTIQLLRSY